MPTCVLLRAWPMAREPAPRRPAWSSATMLQPSVNVGAPLPVVTLVLQALVLQAIPLLQRAVVLLRRARTWQRWTRR